MAIINPYLTFNGNCEEAFNYYKSVFGGEFSYLGRFSEMPVQEGMPAMPEEEGKKIMHVSLPLDGTSTLMGSDTGGEWASGFKEGNNITLSITTNSKEKADDIFGKLANGGSVTMPLANTFWGDYFGLCVDKFGINWMMSYNEKASQDS